MTVQAPTPPLLPRPHPPPPRTAHRRPHPSAPTPHLLESPLPPLLLDLDLGQVLQRRRHWARQATHQLLARAPTHPHPPPPPRTADRRCLVGLQTSLLRVPLLVLTSLMVPQLGLGLQALRRWTRKAMPQLLARAPTAPLLLRLHFLPPRTIGRRFRRQRPKPRPLSLLPLL